VQTDAYWDRSQQPTIVSRLLREVDFVGVNAHAFFLGLPVSCAGLNINGCYDAPTYTVARCVVSLD
jgi:hypothetical protein